jgi:hypothetical protein
MSAESQSASGRRGSKRTRRKRARPLPSQLKAQDLDEIAKRRCLMLLDVLSGRVPVTDAITQGKISRGTYYQLEAKALSAMMAAMSPTAEAGGPATVRTKELEALEQKVKKLEIEKRRLEHLLVVATKIVQSGPLTTGRGRPPKRRSAVAGPTASPDSKPAATKKTKVKRGRPSTPKPSAPAH